MCGIFSLLNNDNQFTPSFIQEQFNKGKPRGPEFSTINQYGIKCQMGFHRLSINGLNSESNQPFVKNDVVLICNGEIYNYRALYKMMGITPSTQSDCEVILHLYKKYGIEYTLQVLDGVFAFVLFDYNINDEISKIYVGRDPYGVRPLYIMSPIHGIEENEWVDVHANRDRGNSREAGRMYGFASEVKMLSSFCQDPRFSRTHEIAHLMPGTYSSFHLSSKVSATWELQDKHVRYHTPGFTPTFDYRIFNDNESKYENAHWIREIQRSFVSAVEKRYVSTERPVACLLSGGLDSSLVTAIVCDLHKQHGGKEPIETYSIGLEGSVDLKYAKKVAEYLGTNHTEIQLTELDFINAIPEVVWAIESYDTTTVRASIGNYLLGKYISENSNAKVIFNGDGSDELTGGYLYMHKCPDALEFDRECRRLLSDIYTFDVLRSDKCISCHGLEPRTPFLDRGWVQSYLSIPPQIRWNGGNKSVGIENYPWKCEKFLLRYAFSDKMFSNGDGNALLPDSVLWRRKEAFSDGVSDSSRSLYQIIQEHLAKIIPIEELENKKWMGRHNKPTTLEQLYYRSLFESKYKGFDKIIPYFWMPKYVNATDASARTLELYTD